MPDVLGDDLLAIEGEHLTTFAMDDFALCRTRCRDGKSDWRNVPQRLDVHLIVDSLSTHKTPAIKRWLLRHPRFHLHFTPTSASWINLVERRFALLTERQLRRGTRRSTRELETAIKSFLDVHNADPKPFVWTKTADQILDSLGRFCARISDSGH